MEIARELVYRHWRQRLAWLIHYLKALLKRKERPRVQRLARFIPEHAVIFDVGAHFGYLSKEFARVHGGGCQVYCFEPVSYTHSILARVMQPFTNARLEALALSDRAGMAAITIPVKPSGRLGIGLSHLGSEPDLDYITETIPLETMDAYVARRGLTRLDFIKIDVEGAELLVLKGGKETLRRLRPLVYCEVQADWTRRLGYTPAELFGFLSALGYAAHVLDDAGVHRVAGHDPRHEDYLFLPHETAAPSGAAQTPTEVSTSA